MESKAGGQVKDGGLDDSAEVHVVQGKAELEKLDSERLSGAARNLVMV